MQIKRIARHLKRTGKLEFFFGESDYAWRCGNKEINISEYFTIGCKLVRIVTGRYYATAGRYHATTSGTTQLLTNENENKSFWARSPASAKSLLCIAFVRSALHMQRIKINWKQNVQREKIPFKSSAKSQFE